MDMWIKKMLHLEANTGCAPPKQWLYTYSADAGFGYVVAVG